MLHFQIDYTFNGSSFVYVMQIYAIDAESARSRFEEFMANKPSYEIQKITVIEDC